MQGYGTIFDISPQRIVRYDVTDISCQATREQPFAAAAREWTQIAPHGRGFQFSMAGGITRYSIEPLSELPPHCRGLDAPPIRDSMLNFWVLWHAFRENYAFFDLRGVDWEAQNAYHRSRLRFDSGEDALLETFSTMIKALNDRHVALFAADRTIRSAGVGEFETLWGKEHGVEEDGAVMAGYRAAVRKHVTQDVLRGRFSDEAALTWGWAAPGIAYVHVATMSQNQYSAMKNHSVSHADFLQQMALAMAQALRQMRGAKALIVDARFNDGGSPGVALRLAGSFTPRRHLAFTRKAVLGAGYTETQEVYIEPSTDKPFTGPIVYLQSGTTTSAAEIFTLAMMSLPQVTRIGTPTYGVLSATLDKTLPNGWRVSLSNEVYMASDGKCYEGSGIPPDIRSATLPGDGFASRARRDIEMALARLAEQ